MAAVAAQRRGEEERKLVNEYCDTHKVNDAVQELILTLLEAKPTNPKEWLLKQIEDELTEESDNLSESDVHRLFAVTRKITSEIVPQDAVDVVINETINLCGCDRVSLFVLDSKKDMLKLHASNMSTPIMVHRGQGIAGTVFQTKTSVNIPDCYKDRRFDSTFDQKTGYVTRSLLAVPIIDFDDCAIGVIQAINKIDPSRPVIEDKPVGTRAMAFTRNDEKILAHLTQHVGIALRNAEVYREAIGASERATGLLNTVQSLSQDLGTQSLLLMVTMHANKIVSAQRATVFLVDDAKDQLWSVSTDTGVEIRIPKHAGIAGECCTEGKTINIPDAYADPRFNQAFDKKNNFKTQSILAIPMFHDPATSGFYSKNPEDKGVVGVIQMINKVSYDGQLESFDEQDVEVMDMFSKFVGPKLASSNMLRKDTHGKEGTSDEATLALGTANEAQELMNTENISRKRMSGIIMDSFEEGENDEEEQGE
jgi:GAF domain-containing protein